MRRHLASALALTAAAALVAACGTTEEPATATPAAPGAAVTLTDARGQAVTLDAPAARTVGTEWNVVEHLASLGVMPVGVADTVGYSAWVTSEPLDATAEDIGTRGEPSIDTVGRLAPDLVVGTTDLSDAAIAQLQSVAPVVVVRSADTADQVGQMFTNLDLIAQATGTQEQAAALRAQYEAKIAEGKAALAAAGLTGQSFAFVDGWLNAGTLAVRPFGQGSLVGEVIEELGLVNAWQGEVDPDYGLGTTDLEGLTQVGDAQHFLYIANDTEADPYGALADNDIWKGLPFVQSGDVHRLPDGIWMFGGPTSMVQLVDAVVAALTTT